MFTAKKGLSPEFRGVPTVYLTERAARQMHRLVHKVDTEVGWLMICHETDQGDFVLSECIVPAQHCLSTTTEFTPQGISEACLALYYEDTAKGIKDDAPEFRYTHLNAWFHSHVNMEASPSGQDDKQMVDFCENYGQGHSTWIRGIVNKRGDTHITVYYRCGKTWKSITGCPVEIKWGENAEIDTAIDKLIAERVRNMPPPSCGPVVHTTIPKSHRSGGTARKLYTPTWYGMGIL